MMIIATRLASAVAVIGSGDDDARAKRAESTREVLIASLDVLCESAEKRGLVADGTLPRLFDEISKEISSR